MFDVLQSPRVRELLEQAEEAVQLLDSSGDPGVREALYSLYADLGKLVHGLARQSKPHMAPLPSHVEAEVLDVYDQDADDLTEIPSPDERVRREAEFDAPHGQVVELKNLQALPVQISENEDLYALLSLLTPPADLLDPDGMPEEASKVQWASGELSGRLADSARTVQILVLAMLAARARNVSAHLDVDIGPRMAIDRLKRYRDHEDLPWVRGLLPNARPELDTWAEDATAYWRLLRPN